MPGAAAFIKHTVSLRATLEYDTKRLKYRQNCNTAHNSPVQLSVPFNPVLVGKGAYQQKIEAKCEYGIFHALTENHIGVFNVMMNYAAKHSAWSTDAAKRNGQMYRRYFPSARFTHIIVGVASDGATAANPAIHYIYHRN